MSPRSGILGQMAWCQSTHYSRGAFLCLCSVLRAYISEVSYRHCQQQPKMCRQRKMIINNNNNNSLHTVRTPPCLTRRSTVIESHHLVRGTITSQVPKVSFPGLLNPVSPRRTNHCSSPEAEIPDKENDKGIVTPRRQAKVSFSSGCAVFVW